jgi:AraC-like DNA-binding protein
MAPVPPARHLLRARDLTDRRYAERIGVSELAATAGLSRAHFSREFSRTFGESPKSYLMTRRLERAAALLRNTDRSVSEICLDVGLVGLGSFTTSFKRHFAKTPTAYRASFPPAAAHVIVPACYIRLYGRPQHSTKGEDLAVAAD